MDYNSISIKPYIKRHLELQREITLIELAPSPYFFCLKCLSCIYEHVCKVWWKSCNDSSRYYGIKTLRTDRCTHGQHENRIIIITKDFNTFEKSCFHGIDLTNFTLESAKHVNINRTNFVSWIQQTKGEIKMLSEWLLGEKCSTYTIYKIYCSILRNFLLKL